MLRRSNRADIPCGNIDLIIGPMFACKSEEMIRRIRRMLIANRKCIVIKFAGDTRYDSKSGSNAIMTHSGNVFNDCTVVVVKTLAEIPIADIETADVIGISEGQFYEDIVEYANKFANAGKSVIIEGLSGDFEQKPFSTISNLIPTVDTITHFNAICTQCRDDNAPFTTRISNDKEKVVIGGADKYRASCRSCISAVRNK